MWKYFESIECLRNFNRQGIWASTSCPSCLEGLAAKNLRFPPWESHTHTSSQEGHTPVRTPGKENDPRGCEIRPSIYYRPESISNAATQLVKKHYPHPSTLLFLCSYVGHGTENSMENLPGKIWKLQLRIVGLPFLDKLSHERQGEVIGFKTCDHPNRGFHRWGNICKESRDWFMVVHTFFCRENEHF